VIDIKLDWWHVVLLGIAAAGLIALAFGWAPGAILTLLGVTGAGVRESQKGESPAQTDPVPDRPEVEESEPVTEYSEAVDEVEESVAEDVAEEMTIDEVEQTIEEGL